MVICLVLQSRRDKRMRASLRAGLDWFGMSMVAVIEDKFSLRTRMWCLASSMMSVLKWDPSEVGFISVAYSIISLGNQRFAWHGYSQVLNVLSRILFSSSMK